MFTNSFLSIDDESQLEVWARSFVANNVTELDIRYGLSALAQLESTFCPKSPKDFVNICRDSKHQAQANKEMLAIGKKYVKPDQSFIDKHLKAMKEGRRTA